MRIVDVMLSIPGAAAGVLDRGARREAEPVDGDHRDRGGPGADLRAAAARLDARPAASATTCWRPARSGSSRAPIVFRHMLPNALGPVIVQATLVLATAIIDAAALSFLGLGNPDDRQPEWGQMLGRRPGVHQRPTRTSRSIPAVVHHRGRPRLHADGRVAARGPRPEVPEVTSMSKRTAAVRPRPQRHLHPARRGAVHGRRRRLASTSTPARRSAWSASPAAASR